MSEVTRFDQDYIKCDTVLLDGIAISADSTVYKKSDKSKNRIEIYGILSVGHVGISLVAEVAINNSVREIFLNNSSNSYRATRELAEAGKPEVKLTLLEENIMLKKRIAELEAEKK